MTVEQLIKDEAKLARKEGIEEGFKQGIEQGIEQGSEHTLIASIKNLMLNMNISIEQAMDYLDVPADKRDAYMSKINL